MMSGTCGLLSGGNLFPARRPRGAMLLFSAVFFAAAVFPLFAQKQQAAAEISVNYEFSVLNLSAKYLTSRSIISWRDIHLHGARLEAREMPSFLADFDRMNLAVSFGLSSYGYHTDDDANNDFLTLSVAETDVLRLDFDFSVESGVSLRKRTGIDFTWMNLKNHDSRTWDSTGAGRPTGTPLGLPGEVSTLYDTLTLCFYFAMATNIVETRNLYLSFSGLAGPGIFAGFGNWPWRPVFRHPISFSDIGPLVRAQVNIEFGFRAGSYTFFCAFEGGYELYPLALDIQYLSNGKLASQAVFADSSRATARLGIKGAF
jgi:hypothetical protein